MFVFRKFAPRCSVCRLPIRPDVEDEEAVRFVALDRSFHIQCYRCEVSNLLSIPGNKIKSCYLFLTLIFCFRIVTQGWDHRLKAKDVILWMDICCVKAATLREFKFLHRQYLLKFK